MPWGTSQWGQTPWGGGNAVSISAVDPPVLDARGGEWIALQGVFPRGVTLTARLGPTGTGSDPACSSGTPGAPLALVSPDGLTLQCATPAPLAKTGLVLRVAFGSLAGTFAIDATEGTHAVRVHSLRRMFAATDAAGARSMAEEPAL